MPLSVGIEFALGAATGLLDCTFFHWIDTLKVRAQDRRPLLMDLNTGGHLRLSRLGVPRFAAASVASLYAGFSTNLSLKLPYMAFMFAFNAFNKQVLGVAFGGQSTSCTLNTAKELASAAMVGVEVSLLLSPLEMIRIQGQNRGKGGLFAAARAVHTTSSGGLTGGWKVWTRGMTATMNREAKYCMGQFFLCQKIADYLAATGADGGRRGGRDGEVSLVSQIAGAVLGGIACTAVSHPDDVIKTRMQTHLRGSPDYASYSGFLASGRRILQSEGLGALFRGAAFRCLLRVPLGLSVIMVSGSAMRRRLEEQR